MKLLLVLALLAAGSHAAAARVDNFQLLDHNGVAHELYYRDAKVVVLMSHGNGCIFVRDAVATATALEQEFADRGVDFLLVNPNPHDDRQSIAAEAAAHRVTLPILVDEAQLIGEALGFRHTSEVLVIDTAEWRIRYRGPVDDRFAGDWSPDKQPTEHFLRDALLAVLDGKPVPVAERKGLGCVIPYDTADTAAISYSETVAPILIDNCVGCHSPGGIGPFAMTGYDIVHGFAPMIREAVRTQRMPPWHADPHVGSWQNARGLSLDDKRALVHWIEAGAPRGNGPDPLATVDHSVPEWPLGEPDIVVTVPAFDVPATGIIDYQFPYVKNPLDRDVWVRAATVAPGDRTVVHHALVGAVEKLERASSPDAVFDNYIIGYVPGAESIVMPEGTGVFVPKGGAFAFQMHYTASGRATTDETRMALYFYDEPPEHIVRHHVILNPFIRIPPNAARHPEHAYLLFHKDAVLHSLFPHAHFRGYSSSFVLRHPDGKEQLLLSVPRYDFNWQREYVFSEPLNVPAGSKLIHRTKYDNTALNRANPDPSRVVPWGLQSYDEMLYGAVQFRWVDETSEHQTHDPRLAEAKQSFGFLDRNIDGRVQWQELPPQLQQRFGQAFPEELRAPDRGLDLQQFIRVIQQQQRVGEAHRGAPDAG
jgi:mono/diheme cytochrome c family protein